MDTFLNRGRRMIRAGILSPQLPMPPDSSYALFLQARKDLDSYAQNDDGSGAPADSSPVGYWASRVGSYIGTQATSSAKPTLITNALNGWPVVRFDGGDYLDLGDVLDMGTNDLTLCVVGKRTGASGTYISKNDGSGTIKGAFGITDYTDGDLYAVYIDDAGVQFANDTAPAVGSYEYMTQVINRSGSNTLYVDGLQFAQALFTDDSAQNLTNALTLKIGAYEIAGSPGVRLSGDIAEVILYQGLPDLTALHNYVTSKFGL